jgi:N6-adenosine-specific RNA methylase IME4
MNEIDNAAALAGANGVGIGSAPQQIQSDTNTDTSTTQVAPACREHRSTVRACIALPAALFGPLPTADGGFCCVHADPPLRFRSNSAARPGRNAMRHYKCLSPHQIATLPLKEVVADDAYLFLWVPGPFLAIGAHTTIMREWGFEPTAMGFVWVKLNRNAPARYFDHRDLFMGPGLTTRKNCEFVIIGRRGRPERLSKDVREIILAPVREHSRKPDEIFERIERFCAGPRVDLFARQRREGWAVWGDETEKFEKPTVPTRPRLEAAE